MPLPAVHLVLGTPSEAISLAPLAAALRAAGRLEPVVVACGRHPVAVARTLVACGQEPDVELGAPGAGGDTSELVARQAVGLDDVLARRPAVAVVVPAGTTSALVGGLVAFWRDLPVVRVAVASARHERREETPPSSLVQRMHAAAIVSE